MSSLKPCSKYMQGGSFKFEMGMPIVDNVAISSLMLYLLNFILHCSLSPTEQHPQELAAAAAGE